MLFSKPKIILDLQQTLVNGEYYLKNWNFLLNFTFTVVLQHQQCIVRYDLNYLFGR